MSYDRYIFEGKIVQIIVIYSAIESESNKSEYLFNSMYILIYPFYNVWK